MKRALFTMLLARLLSAQPTVAPTNAPTGPPRGENAGGYNITNSFELGVRFRDVHGDLGKYRSDVNYGNGLRLLGSSLTVHSREGQGGYFDELLLNTQGLGNDPYQFANLRVQKNKLYRYDLLWRENAYFNPAPPIARGQHLLDTERRLQDHSLVLLPQSSLRILAGYSRNTQGGSGLNTVLLFDQHRGDEYPLFAAIRREQNEYRLGFEIPVILGSRLSVVRGWEYFKDDSRLPGVAATRGNNPADLNTLTGFRRDEPYHGSTRNWRIHLLSERTRAVSWNGRFTYAEGRRNFLFDELASGSDRLGLARTRQTLLSGNARRPVSSGHFSFSLLPSDAVTVTNQTSFHSTRIDGDGSFSEINNATGAFRTLLFQYLANRTIANQTDVQISPKGWLGVGGGYHYSTRRIRSIEQETFENVADRRSFEQDNALHSGVASVRLRPMKTLSVLIDGEIGRADRPFFPISERKYHALGGRFQYRGRNAQITALARSNYNTNTSGLALHSARSRHYGIDGSFTPRTWLSFDAGYNKLHLDTLSALAFFWRGSLTNGQSVYRSNLHAFNAAARIGMRRVDWTIGYSRVEDTAQPGIARAESAPEIVNLPGLASVYPQAYPATFGSPLARFSLRLHTKLRWNAGYQYYHFRDDFPQRYGAHTGYTSLTWSF